MAFFSAQTRQALRLAMALLLAFLLLSTPLLSQKALGYVILSSESGPLDGFKITGLSGDIQANQNLTITVSAVDASGVTVTDYEGTIRFSSTDSSATLPNDYTFLPSDQGRHQFNLSLKFVTPGDQTLTVTDLERFTIQEEAGFTVVLGDDSPAEFGSDFVVDDFERQGDFTLTAPATGTYSVNSIDIQGEASYGNSFVVYMNDKEMDRGEVDFDDTFNTTITGIADGTYELYVDIVKLGDGEPGDEEILEVLESSDSEQIIIDTTAPQLVSISSNPSNPIATGAEITLTVLSEADLGDASILFEGELYTLDEDSVTNGKYSTSFPMPEEEGDYGVDVILVDRLGNEVQYRDALVVSTSAELAEPEPEEGSGSGELGLVTGITATPADGSIILSWEPVDADPAVAYYKIQYGPSPTALFASSETADASTTWTIPELIGEQLYYFSISAVNIEGDEGPESNPVLGVPLGKSSFDGDIPGSTPEPAISDSELPPEQPETGPELYIILFISILGGMGYVFAREGVE